MKKKITLLTALMLCVACIVAGAAATEVIREIKAELRPDFTIEIDGDIKEFKNAQGETVYPILYDGTTYLPIRAIGEIMGKTVYWYEDDKKVVLRNSTVTDADVIIVGKDESSKDVSKDKDKSEQNKNQKPDNKRDDKDKVKNNDASDYIGETKAKEFALEKAGVSIEDVKFEKIELDRDDGRIEYEIEFRVGKTEYEAGISAIDGTIYSWKVDDDD